MGFWGFGVLGFWGFGVHQSSAGYGSQKDLETVYNGYKDKKIPLDGLWSDVNYMQGCKQFTVDTENYPKMKEFVTLLHSHDVHFIPILLPSLKVEEGYSVYEEAVKKYYLITNPESDVPTEGIGCGGYSVYPFTNSGTREFWYKHLEELNAEVPLDGVWMSMNEPSTVTDGEVVTHTEYILREPHGVYDSLIYIPGHRSLQLGTLLLSGRHSTTGEPGAPKAKTPEEKGRLCEFNMHNMYGHMMARPTSQYFSDIGRRPFVLSRSTFPGTGRMASHWLGENKAYWEMMRLSLPGIYNSQMFGMPMVGADVCGYKGDTTVELCRRWYQLGAFYPLMRNHNDQVSVPQEPYTDHKLTQTALTAIHLRYFLTRYFYSLYMDTALLGGVYFTPLLFHFPHDMQTYTTSGDSFMVGKVKVSPVLTENPTEFTSYFPNAHWFELSSGQQILSFNPNSSAGHNMPLPYSLESEVINTHILGGSIVGVQPNGLNITNIQMLLQIPISIRVAPDHNDQGEGFLTYDNGHGPATIPNNEFHKFIFRYNKGVMTVALAAGDKDLVIEGVEETVDTFFLYGAVFYKDKTQGCALVNGVSKSLLVTQESYNVLKMLSKTPIPLMQLTRVHWGTSQCVK